MLSNLPLREEYLKKRRRQKLFKYGAIALLVILILGIFIYIAYRPEVRISKVELSGGVLVTQADIEEEALSFMHGSYLWLVPKNDSFIYPKKALALDLRDSFPRIDTIDISLKDLNTLSINITERKAVAIWCDTLPSSESLPPPDAITDDGSYKSQGFCYFMDQNSNIFAEAPNFIAGGGEIWFDTIKPLPSVSENLQALLSNPPFSTYKGNLPIQYIDLRFGNKLFYKLK